MSQKHNFLLHLHASDDNDYFFGELLATATNCWQIYCRHIVILKLITIAVRNLQSQFAIGFNDIPLNPMWNCLKCKIENLSYLLRTRAVPALAARHLPGVMITCLDLRCTNHFKYIFYFHWTCGALITCLGFWHHRGCLDPRCAITCLGLLARFASSLRPLRGLQTTSYVMNPRAPWPCTRMCCV